MNSRAKIEPVLIVHGGAGARGPASAKSPRRRGLLAAAASGGAILRAGGDALDAVVAVMAMEDNPAFNAGLGSVLNSEGRVEMDASVMASRPVLAAGAVAAVTRARNPVLLARYVMEHTRHVLIVGPAADKLVRRAKLPAVSPSSLITPRARERFEQFLNSQQPAAEAAHGTVGAVAVDRSGKLASATSTGGMTGKLAGRVGDSAVIGAGTFADLNGAASATGVGEAIMKVMLCRDAIHSAAELGAQRAAVSAIRMLTRVTRAQAGIIIVDRRGRPGYAHSGQMMDIAVFQNSLPDIRYLALKPIARLASA